MDITNADRVVFPEVGVTKGDVVAYYEKVGDRMMAFVAGRALTVERYPKGLEGKGFMQKNAPEHFSDELVGRHAVEKEDGGTTTYPVISDRSAMTAFANLGVITFHAPPTRVSDEGTADWMIWDLDPAPGDFPAARRAGWALREVLQSFGVETVLMTSGSNGYHLRAALEPGLASDEAGTIARGLSAIAAAAYPDLMTLAFRKNERAGRVFVDWLRNAPYSTSVVPWSLRARPRAPIAVPIIWEELDVIDPDGVTLGGLGPRLEMEPWEGYQPQDLTSTGASVADALSEAKIDLEPFDRFRSR